MDGLAHAARSSEALGDTAVTLPLLAVVACVWFLEQQRREGHGSLLPGLGQGLRRLAPELACLAACAGLAAALLHARRGVAPWHGEGARAADDTDREVWQEITSEWPYLTTADSLLALQAMVRLVLVVSAALRCGAASPLAGEPAAFLLLAAAGRVLLLGLSPSDVYHLEGPLGGHLNLAFETLCLPGLLWLAWSLAQAGARRVLAVASAALLAGCAAWHHRFSLADAGQVHLDVLFSTQLLLEFLAAGAFVMRSLAAAANGIVATSLTHVLLPLQQLLQTVFILTAFAKPFEAVPELVGAGRPFEVMQVCSIVQVGLYVLAGIWHFVLREEAVKVAEEGGIPLISVA